MIHLEIDQTGKVWASIQNVTGQAFEGSVSHALRLFGLLKREQLATTATPGGPRYGTANPAGDVTMTMNAVVVDEMRRMLMLPAAAT